MKRFRLELSAVADMGAVIVVDAEDAKEAWNKGKERIASGNVDWKYEGVRDQEQAVIVEEAL